MQRNKHRNGKRQRWALLLNNKTHTTQLTIKEMHYFLFSRDFISDL